MLGFCRIKYFKLCKLEFSSQQLLKLSTIEVSCSRMSVVEKRASEEKYKTFHLSKYDRCTTYMWLYWEELKLQFLFAFRQVKTHSKILPVESLFIIVFFYRQTDTIFTVNLNIVSMKCPWFQLFEYRVQTGFIDLSTVHPPSVLLLSQTFLSGNLLKAQEMKLKGTDNKFNISFFFFFQYNQSMLALAIQTQQNCKYCFFIIYLLTEWYAL